MTPLSWFNIFAGILMISGLILLIISAALKDDANAERKTKFKTAGSVIVIVDLILVIIVNVFVYLQQREMTTQERRPLLNPAA